MNRISNRVFATGSALSIALMVAAPATGVALGARDEAKTAVTPKTSQFCTNLPNDANTVTSKLSDLQGKLTQAWSQQDQKLATAWQNVDQKVAAERQKADSDRAADFVKLEAKATTGTQKQAVQDYETAVNNAVSTRRAAYDSARTTFRNGVQAAISARRSTISGQESTFVSSVNSAISTAEASCASNPGEGVAARTAFVASLKSARQTFEADRKGDAGIDQQVKQLAATRDAAFQAADQAFQSSLKSARQALEQAFGKSSI